MWTALYVAKDGIISNVMNNLYIMYAVYALLCFFVVLYGRILKYPTGLLPCPSDNDTIIEYHWRNPGKYRLVYHMNPLSAIVPSIF